MRNLGVLLAALALPATHVLAHGNPRGETKLTVGGKAIAIEYGRPSLNGRDMLGKAAIGQTWRLGADAPTTLRTEADLAFAGAAVPKGDYVLTATRMAEDRWTLNVETRDPAKPSEPGTKVAQAPLSAIQTKESVETLTIDLVAVAEGRGSALRLEIKWGTTVLRTRFGAK